MINRHHRLQSTAVTEYTLRAAKCKLALRVVILSDLHRSAPEPVLCAVANCRPDLILIPGDLMEDLRAPDAAAQNVSGMAVLQGAAQLAPVFYAPGNHEKTISTSAEKAIASTGAVLLQDCEADCFPGLLIGGLNAHVKEHSRKSIAPNLDFLRRFGQKKTDRCKVLLCHMPEYYPRYILPQQLDIDLIVSGHAHGGQWRIGKQGIFAPGQGIFPKYTAGIHDNRLVISRGLGGMSRVPRINNPPEVLLLHLLPQITP